uniref:Uncharacterized protein n=1 Tax=Rhizophagus irregularis (strain DAOM 181602 / DAOM 197198 / MUCL 43194) TaxID=747089 RepID=U9UMK1_RHIID
MDPHSDSKDCYLFLITGNGSRFRSQFRSTKFEDIIENDANFLFKNLQLATRSLYCEFMNLYLKEARKKKAEFEGKCYRRKINQDINLEPKVIYKNYGPNRCYRDDVTLVDRTKGTRGGRSLRD